MPPEDRSLKRQTWAQSEGTEKNTNGIQRKAGIAIRISDQIDFKK